VVVTKTEISWNSPAVLECEHLYADMHCHGGALHRMSAFHAFCSDWTALYRFFSVWQYTSDIIVVPRCMNSTMSTTFLSHKTSTISFLADNVCLNFFGLSAECVCIHCLTADCSFVSTLQMKPKFHHILLVRCDGEIHCPLCGFALKKSKTKPFSAFCVHPWAFSEPTLHKTCDDSLV
jgi:hypothetical protein